MKTLRWLAALACCVPLWAQGQTLSLEPSQALACLSPARELRGQPEYPFELWKREEKGRVKVTLAFDKATSAPDVTVVESEGDDGFVDAVKAHVRTLRVPCLPPGTATTRIEIEYVFRPETHKVVAGTPMDLDRQAQAKMFSCLQHESGDTKPQYPVNALRYNLQGRIWLDLHFDSADQPPQARVYSSRAAGPLARAIEDLAEGFRLPCYQGQPVDFPVSYVFKLDDDEYGFKDVGFTQFVSSIKGIHEQTLDFDFSTMKCPFNLRFALLRPQRRNQVYQLDSYHPAREPFVEWLKDVELSLPTRALDSVYADSLVLTVPCVRLNLTP